MRKGGGGILEHVMIRPDKLPPFRTQGSLRSI